MRKLILTAVVALAALCAVPAATADTARTTWWWTADSAEATLIDEGIQWDAGDGYDEVYEAVCFGLKPVWRSRGVTRYQHFNCYIEAYQTETDEDEYYYVRVDVLGKYNWTVDFLRWADE
jgi:hypothetical protein